MKEKDINNTLGIKEPTPEFGDETELINADLINPKRPIKKNRAKKIPEKLNSLGNVIETYWKERIKNATKSGESIPKSDWELLSDLYDRGIIENSQSLSISNDDIEDGDDVVISSSFLSRMSNKHKLVSSPKNEEDKGETES